MLSRTSTHKVRTGCITCKKRHIKCDEAKPHCDNCIRSRRRCEGYAVGPKKPTGPVQLCWDSRAPVYDATPRVQLRDSPRFHDATGMLCFQEFVSLLQGSWNSAASGSGGDLWAVTLPQLAHSSHTLQYAAMAIGSLSKWHQQSTTSSLRAVSLPAVQSAADAHYFHAMTYYCHALKLQSQRESVQDAVFFSLLSVFFESLQGNRKAAIDHVNHGLALLLAVLTNPNPHSDHHVTNFAPDPKPILGTVADIFTHLAMQARTVLRGRFDQGPPLPHLARGLRENQHTMESFMTLLSQLPRSSAITNRIPTLFNSLDEFERYWAMARREQTAMVSIMAEVMRTAAVLGSQDEFFHVLLDNPRIKEFSEYSRRKMQAIDAAFLPLFNWVIMTEAGSPTYLKAIHLRLQYLGVYLFEDPPQYLNVETVRARTPSFHEYLSLAEMALCTVKDEMNPSRHLSLQCGLAWNLCLLALFCRDPLARDHAVKILKDYPGQDGLWNTRSLYVLALRNRAVELANTVEGTHVEQWQRLWRREFVFEDGGERILFRYLQRDEATGEWQLVEEMATVGTESEQVDWKGQPLTGSGGPLMVDLYTPN